MRRQIKENLVKVARSAGENLSISGVIMAESKKLETENSSTVFNIKFISDELIEDEYDVSASGSDVLIINEEEEESVKEILEHVCGKCKRSYSNFYALKKHVEQCKNKKDDRLVDEDYEELSIDEIIKLHKAAKGMAKRNMCFCCEESLETAHTGHIRCQDCPKSFKTAKNFQRHMSLLHSSSSEYPCEVCNAKCPTSVILEIHTLAHENGKPFSCQKCGKDFTRRYHLQRHQQHSNCDPLKQKPEMECNVCGKGFFRIDNLRNHLRGHMGENTKNRDYQCPYCDKAFFGTTTMNIHIRTHTGERPFICDLCQRGFPSNGALRKHRRSHTGEKPFKCSVCDRAFAAKEVLNRHMKTHTGERPHICNNCGKTFIQATQLKAHMFHHTGEHGFPCEKCGTEFNRKIKLTEHMKEYHNEEKNMFDCKSCKKEFDNKPDLIDHMKLHEYSKGYKCRSCKKKYLSIKVHRFCSYCKICKDYTEDDVLMHEHATSPPKLISMQTIICDESETSPEVQRRKIKILTSKPKKSTPSNKVQDDTESSFKINKSVNEAPLDDDADKPIIDDEEVLVMDVDSNSQLNEVNDELSDELQQYSIFMDDDTLKDCVAKLLSLLLDKELLAGFGWPTASVEHVLSAVIKQCGHEPADYDSCSDYTTKIRENVKLLFNVVIDNDSFKRLLNNHTIDEVILQILQMAN